MNRSLWIVGLAIGLATPAFAEEPPVKHLFRSVNTWSYCLQHANWYVPPKYPASERQAVLEFWANHYDILVGARPANEIKAIRPDTLIYDYNIATGMTAYDRGDQSGIPTYSYELEELRNFVPANFNNPSIVHSFSSADEAFEDTFAHVTRDSTWKFVSGESIDTTAYDPANPRASRAPGGWEKNSDWIMNIYNPFFAAFWKQKLIEKSAGIDGIMLDVHDYPKTSSFPPETGMYREFTTLADYIDKLKALTSEWKTAMNANGFEIGGNNYKYESDGKLAFEDQLDFVLREGVYGWNSNPDPMQEGFDKQLAAAKRGKKVLLNQAASFAEFMKDRQNEDYRTRDYMAGLAAYVMIQHDNMYYFPYTGGFVYSKDMRTEGWFDAMAYDFGVPLAPYEVVERGIDPTKPPEYHDNYRDYHFIVLRRKLSKGWAYFKTKAMRGVDIEDAQQMRTAFGDATATTYPLDGVYYRLKANGTLDTTPITELSLRNWEGAILIRSDIKPPAAPKSLRCR